MTKYAKVNYMKNKVVILVPTKGRLDWCIAKLRYYSNFKNSPSILFLDASEKSNYNLLYSISNKKSQSTIHYLHLPNQSIHFSIEEGLKYALGKWDYFVISGDDDFHLPKMLNEAAKFLDLNKDFVAVTGNAVIARMQISVKRIRVLTCAKYWKPYSIIKKSPLERFSLLVKNYLNLEFSVKRVNAGLNIATSVNKFNGELTFQESGFSEYCTATAIPLLGKIQNFNRLLMVRGDHPARPFSKPRTESTKHIELNISLAYRIYRRIISIKLKILYYRVFRLIASN